MEIEWTSEGRESLLFALDRFQHFGGAPSARRFLIAVSRATERIAQFPYSGKRVSPAFPASVRYVRVGRYVLVYAVLPDSIQISGVLYRSRDIFLN